MWNVWLSLVAAEVTAVTMLLTLWPVAYTAAYSKAMVAPYSVERKLSECSEECFDILHIALSIQHVK